MKTIAINSIFVLFAFVVGIAATAPTAFADHMTAEVSIPSGTSVPGCEETKECYVPYTVTIDPGGEVTWSNNDSAAHTVTSGTAKDGPDGNFDSSLFMAGTTFSHKFDNFESGTYPYICMVHPWMTGEIIVVNDNFESYSNLNITPKEQNKPKTIDTLIKQKSQPISIWSDKSNYVDGSIIHIDGKIKDAKPNAFVNIRVYSPSNYNIADERVLLSNAGKFKIDFDTSDKLWFENGDYIIKFED
ncbi:MAG: plastocyanin/azurin family copper-binding protein, partial [Nitrosopumilaceae archaeon]